MKKHFSFKLIFVNPLKEILFGLFTFKGANTCFSSLLIIHFIKKSDDLKNVEAANWHIDLMLNAKPATSF